MAVRAKSKNARKAKSKPKHGPRPKALQNDAKTYNLDDEDARKRHEAALKPLTAKEDAFVKEFCIDGNQTAAAERAGYTTDNREALAVLASRLVRKVNVARAIRLAKADIAKAKRVSAEEVIDELRDTLVAARLEGDLKTRVSVSKALGQTIGMFGSKIELSGVGGMPLVPNSGPLTEEQANDIRWMILGVERVAKVVSPIEVALPEETTPAEADDEA